MYEIDVYRKGRKVETLRCKAEDLGAAMVEAALQWSFDPTDFLYHPEEGWVTFSNPRKV